MNDQTDYDVVNLAKAIRQRESKGNFEASGDAGTSYGAYQWNNGKVPLAKGESPANYKAAAKRFLGDENAPMTPANQNAVAYSQIKEWKDQGLNPAQIAAKWNSGSEHGWENKVGVATINGQKVKYNVPEYVKEVTDNYQSYKGQNSQAPISQQPSVEFNPIYPQTPENARGGDIIEKPDTLGGNLAKRVGDVTGALNTAGEGVSGLLSSKDTLKSVGNIGSGLLQTAGAAAGAVGDVVNAGIELIPGVTALEKVIGNQTANYMKTESGQAIASELQKFQQQNPQFSKNIGAVINIATAIPILRGLGVVKNVVLDSASLALKNTAESIATKDLTKTIAKTAAGRKALEQSPNVAKVLVSTRAIPDIVDGKFVTSGANELLGGAIEEIENNQLRPLLQGLNTSKIADRQSIETLRKKALQQVKDEFKATGSVGKAESEVNRIFNDYKSSYGDYVSLNDVNDMKRGIRQSVNFNSPKIDSDVSYHIGQVFMKDIEDQAKKLGLPDVAEINAKMGELIKAQKALKYIDGKTPDLGAFGGAIKGAGAVGGEVLGTHIGIPFAGTYLGYKGASLAGKVAPKNVIQGVLKKTGPNAVRQTGKEAAKKTLGLIKGALIQKAAQ